MKPATVALRDQITALLRGTDGALATDDIAKLMPPATFRRICHPQWCGETWRNPNVLSEICDGDGMHTVTMRRFGPEVYPHLRAMERKGLCTRVHVPDRRPVYWMWTGPADELTDRLEADWAVS